VLGRLERDGYVKSRWESPAIAQREKRPPRRYYTITASGAKVLAESLQHYRTIGSQHGASGKPQTS
jgi:DNA-binding PadR family transcriptional regulator